MTLPVSLLVLSVGLAAAPTAAQEDTTLLRWRFQAGQTLYLTSATRVEYEMRFVDQVIPTHKEHREVSRLVVDAVRDDGGADVTYTFLHTFAVPTTPDEERISDALRGVSLALGLSSEGEVVELEGHAELLERISGGDAASAAAIGAVLSEENLRKKLSDIFVALPGRAVAPGETWTREKAMSLGPLGDATFTTTFRLAGPRVEGDSSLVRVEIGGQGRYGPQAAVPAGEVRFVDGKADVPKGEAWFLFDPELGRVTRVRGRVHAEFALELDIRGEKSSGTGELVFTNDLRLVEDPLAASGSPTMAGFDTERDPARLAAFFERACENGDAVGCLERSQQLAPEPWTGPPPAESLTWLRRGADLGFAAAQSDLGDYYLEGVGVPQSYEEARRYYSLAVAQGDVQARWKLDEVDRTEELSLSQDPAALAALFERRCEGGDARGCYERGRLSLQAAADRREPPAEALELLTRAAELGHAEARVKLAGLHLRGAGVERSEAEARRLYALAAEAGDSTAERMLEHLDGRAAELAAVDQEHLERLRTAAEAGGVRAMVELGETYRRTGYEELAEDWFWRASEQGLPLADHSLGELYSQWNAVAHDEVTATRCYRRAAERELPEAQYELGRRLAEGDGAEADSAEALSWLQRAAEQDHEKAQIQTGHAYHAGRAVAPSPVEATRWLVRPFFSSIWGHYLVTAARDFSEGRGRDLPWAGILLTAAYLEEDDPDERVGLRDSLAAIEGEMTWEERSALNELRAARSADEAWHTAAREAYRALSRRDFETAEALSLEALAEAERARGPDHLDVASSLQFLALARLRGASEGVREPLERAIRIREARQGPGHRRLLEPLKQLAAAVDGPEAEPLLRRALAIAERAHGGDSREVAEVLEPLADRLVEGGDPAQALPLLERAVRIREMERHQRHAHVETLVRLARAHDALGDAERAERHLLAAVTHGEGDASPLRTGLDALGSFYLRHDRPADAEPVFRRLLEVIAADARLERLYAPNAARRLGLALEKLERPAEAVEFHARACEADARYCGSLGFVYLLGKGVEKDAARATALFERACDAGASIPCKVAGDSYGRGRGVAQDLERAATHYQRACDLGAASGCERLEELTRTPRRVPGANGLSARFVEEMKLVAVVGEPGSETAFLLDADEAPWAARPGDALADGEILSVRSDSVEIVLQDGEGATDRLRLALFADREPEPLRDGDWTGAPASLRFEGDLTAFAQLIGEAFGVNVCIERQAEDPVRVVARQQPWDAIVGTALAGAGLDYVIDRSYLRFGRPDQLAEIRLLGREPKGTLVSFAFRRGSLDDIARLFADIAERPVELSPSDRPRLITLRVRDVPWDEALELMVASLGGSVAIDEDRIVISGVP